MNKIKFSELALSQQLQQAITDMGFTEASPIQTSTIPLLLEGKDIVGQAQTGTGKTAAFGIPMIELASKEGTSSVVVCPTRELAIQVTNELKKLAKYRRELNIVTLYGGEPIMKQLRDLRRGAHIVVGTPGRLKDHLDRKSLSFAQVNMTVLDEADEMLNMGFRDDIEAMLQRMPAARQTVLFSATMSKPILDIARRFQKDPAFIKVATANVTAPTIEQIVYETKENLKTEAMVQLMEEHEMKLVIVFCNTKRKVDMLAGNLKMLGHRVGAIHGDIAQNKRNSVLDSFRAGRIKILVATDVAARGIDVNGIDAVFNYDIPRDIEYYVHRIGRTGRAGNVGKAFSFVATRDEKRQLKAIEAYTKSHLIVKTMNVTKNPLLVNTASDRNITARPAAERPVNNRYAGAKPANAKVGFERSSRRY